MSKVASFESYPTNTQTHTHTLGGPIALPGPPKWSVKSVARFLRESRASGNVCLIVV